MDEERALFRRNYGIAAAFLLLILAYGLQLSGGHLLPLLQGLRRIALEPATLITDYVALAGAPSALTNAALVGLIGLGLCALAGAPLTGPALAAVLTLTGFGLFGKNLLNIWPVLLGVWLHGRIRRVPFRDHLLIALFGTALAPLVSELAFGLSLSSPGRLRGSLLLGLFGGGVAGFLLPPLARHMLSAHQGYNLYNVGFTCGFMGTLTLAVLRAFGIPLSGRFLWASGANVLFAGPLLLFLCLLILAGYLLDPIPFPGLREIRRSRGRLVSDFVRFAGTGASLVNMGLVGLMGLGYLFLVGGDLNGPTLGAVLTLTGFAAFGVHPRNAWPPMAGAWLASHLSVWSPDDPAAILAALFSTTLAPLAGGFGPVTGALAGGFNLCLSMGIGQIHGGLNLYNNGFAGGIVAMMMLPILESFRDE